MGRLIDADELYLGIVEKGQASKRYKIGERWELNGAEIWEVINAQPTMILEPKTGRWMTEYLDGIPGRRAEIKYCSECCQVSPYRHKFCPNCGARMEGGKDASH